MLHKGACHCRTVRYVHVTDADSSCKHKHYFQFEAPEDVEAWDCTCSICSLKRNTHIIVPEVGFTVTSGADNLIEYRFNTGTARHLFCGTCGVVPFYRPRSNPDGYAVTLYAVQPGTLRSVTIRCFDGQHWEAHAASEGLPALCKDMSDVL